MYFSTRPLIPRENDFAPNRINWNLLWLCFILFRAIIIRDAVPLEIILAKAFIFNVIEFPIRKESKRFYDCNWTRKAICYFRVSEKVFREFSSCIFSISNIHSLKLIHEQAYYSIVIYGFSQIYYSRFCNATTVFWWIESISRTIDKLRKLFMAS